VTTYTSPAPSPQSPDEAGDGRPRSLRRELPLVAVIGVSLATMAPSFGINTNPQGMAPVVGATIPLAFILATFGVLLVAYSFMRLSQRFDHSGAVYVQVGATIGPRTGVLAGWLLIGTYIMFGVLASIASGRFVLGLVQEYTGSTPPDAFAYAVALIVLLGVTMLGLGTVKRSTTVLVIVEATTVILITIVAIVIVFHLMKGDSPHGQKIDMGVFRLSSGLSPTDLLLGVTFGFLSFAGFEAAITLGDEAKNARTDIPRALIIVPIFAGIFFVLVSAVEVMGFGTSSAGMAAFENSDSLMGQLANEYLSSWVGDLITIGAMCSAISATLACVVAASRILFALGQDGVVPRRFAVLSPRRAAPSSGVILAGSIIAVLEILAFFFVKASPLNLFIQAGSAGVIMILVVYALATIGMCRWFFLSGRGEVPMWQIIFPTLAVLFLGYTLWCNFVPFPQGIDLWAPAVALVWFISAIVVAIKVNGVPSVIARKQKG
jgi:hypothetical protein